MTDGRNSQCCRMSREVVYKVGGQEAGRAGSQAGRHSPRARNASSVSRAAASGRAATLRKMLKLRTRTMMDSQPPTRLAGRETHSSSAEGRVA